jgi:hypothetical protein
MATKVKRIREKQFTPVRNHYKTYNKAPWDWIEIFEQIESLKATTNMYFKEISLEYNINRTTLRNKYNKWILDGRPNIIDDNRGLNKKMFTELEELELFNYIKEVYLDSHILITNDDIRSLALEKWNLLYPDKIGLFNASVGWCTDFKKKMNLSSVKPRFSKIASHQYSTKEIEEFKQTCKTTKDLVSVDNFFNMDETFWRTINFCNSTIGIKGSESTKVNYRGNCKKGFTVALIISASGKLLLPNMIAKGKTVRCLPKFSLDNKKIIGHVSESGWMNERIMIEVFEQIFLTTDGQKSCLLLDQFSSHTTDYIKKEARKRKITLIYVPIGMTGELQPLDIKINGIIKGYARKLWKQSQLFDPFSEPTMSDAVIHLLESLSIITEDTIINSFESLFQ